MWISKFLINFRFYEIRIHQGFIKWNCIKNYLHVFLCENFERDVESVHWKVNWVTNTNVSHNSKSMNEMLFQSVCKSCATFFQKIQARKNQFFIYLSICYFVFFLEKKNSPINEFKSSQGEYKKSGLMRAGLAYREFCSCIIINHVHILNFSKNMTVTWKRLFCEQHMFISIILFYSMNYSSTEVVDIYVTS